MTLHARLLIFLAATTTLLAACGGGSNDPAPAPATPAPPASVRLAPAMTSISKDLSQGDELAITLGGTWTGSNLGSAPVYLQMRDAANGLVGETRLLQPSETLGSVTTAATLGAGQHVGNLELRACADAQCGTVYAESTMSLPYSLDVAVVTDWETHQRDAAHRGYVPITLKPSRFALAWEWQRPPATEPIGAINSVATAAGKVYVTTDVYHGEATLYALDESTGGEAWKRAFGVMPALAPPAVANGKVYAATSGHADSFLWAFDAAQGNLLGKASFDAQWPNLLAPTPSGSLVFTGAGYYGSDTYAFSTENYTRAWMHSAGGARDMFTPAADAGAVYHYNGESLYVIDRAAGTTSFSIADPFGKNYTFGHYGSPILGGRKNVLAFAGNTFSGRAASSAEPYDQRVISSFNLENRSFEWATANAYMTTPAVANGVIYAGRNSPMSLDAIDEASGKVLWSWVPSGNGDASFHRNVVVTNNLLFVSTDIAVYAIDLASKTPVWRYPKPGMLAISADRTLYIATGATLSDGGLVAVKLK